MSTQRSVDAMAVPHSPAASQILTERLQAHRMDSKRGRRRTDFGPVRTTRDDDIFMAEAEASSEHDGSIHHQRRRSQIGPIKAGGNPTRAPGLKEMDDKLQKLEKQNFDLKMEVFHRREREEKLHDQLRKMHDHVLLAQKMQREHATLLELNASLAQELDKSNEAVDQAVQMICELETKVDMLQARPILPSIYSDSGYGESTSNAMSFSRGIATKQYLNTEDMTAGRLSPGPGGQNSNARRRVPSFMTDSGSNTLALRETYAGSSKNLRQAMSFISMLSDDTAKEEDKTNDLGSPTLSALSESSFPSIYNIQEPLTETGQPTETDSAGETHSSERYRDSHHANSVEKVSTWVRQGHDSPVTQPEIDTERRSYDDTTDHSQRVSTSSSGLDSDFVEYPDGGSIIRGTPSRFRKRSEPSASPHHDDTTRPPVQHRRMSSAEVHPHDDSRERPNYVRAESSPTTEHNENSTRQDWSLTTHPERHTTPTKSNVARRYSTRASLAAKTQRLWDRLSPGPRDSTSPPAKPRMDHRKPLTKSATAADVGRPLGQHAEHSGQMSPGYVGMHYANPTQAAARRRSADAGVQRQRVPTMSKTGAQAAWESKAGRGEGGSRRDTAWKA